MRRPDLGKNKRTKKAEKAGPVLRGSARTSVRQIANPVGRFIKQVPVTRDYREGEYTHVSDLLYKCMRLVAISGQMGVLPPEEPIWPAMSLVHEMGEAGHDWVKGRIMQETGNVFGNWACICGHTTVERALLKQAETNICEKCGYPADVYKELTLRDEEYKLVGNCDLAVEYANQYVLSELKTISRAQFDTLTDAKPDHKMQLHFYSWMAQREGLSVYKRMSVFYICREWVFGSPFKEFIMDASESEEAIQPYLAEAAAIRDWKHRNGQLPQRTLCATKDDKRAVKCPMVSRCFSL